MIRAYDEVKTQVEMERAVICKNKEFFLLRVDPSYFDRFLPFLSQEELDGIATIWGYTLAKGKLWWMITKS